MEQRTDDCWTKGEALQVCSWATFRRFWNREFPNLLIPRPSEDICGLCYTFAQGHKYRSHAAAQPIDSDNDEPSIDDDSTAKTLDERENLLLEAAQHVREAQAMRKFAQEKTAQAKDDAEQKRPRSESTKTLFADYSQGAELPYFGSEQPGETYYYSPLTVNIFGIVDTSAVEDHLHAYVYDESEGKKGGRNVCSLLLKHLDDKGLLDPEDPFEELVLIMDNCSGQNKNKMVLRLVVYLVERGYFHRVTFAFLIVGHTKNPCDRLFNLAKLTYRKSNVFTHQQFLEKVGENQHVTAYPVTAANMKDYDRYFDALYRDFKDSKTLKWQVFTSTSENPTEMTLATSTLPNAETQTLDLKKRRVTDQETDREQRFDHPVPVLPKPGIRPIKQVELYTKYRPLVPEEYRDSICPKPSDEVMAMVRAEKKDKRDNKK
jgi:hypothetical protein